ncbi:MAG: choice-of-anchor tandem repeat NxxGxxAF-containing protein [Burkholderiaceae bacterium]
MAVHFVRYTLTPIATNEGRFVDFAPYVPAINDDGVVAFQATLADGHSGVFTSDGQRIADVAVTTSGGCPARLFRSHPDINRAGTVTVYATLKNGDEAALLVHPDGRVAATGTPAPLGGIGPLGPTMNERGEVALRATTLDGQACIGVWGGGPFRCVAAAGEHFGEFEGLPVINRQGQVAFRAALPGGRQGVFVHRDGACTAVATTGDELEEIARFPIIDDHGGVAFVARRRDGAWGIFTAAPGRPAGVVEAGAGFESLRGVLVNRSGPVVFYGTPRGGQLGIYTGAGPLRHRALGLGDALFGGLVADFALNPVSVNEAGQWVVRVALDDGRQFILRADPVA